MPSTSRAAWKRAKLLMNVGNAIDALCGRAARFGALAQLADQEAPPPQPRTFEVDHLGRDVRPALSMVTAALECAPRRAQPSAP